ncbi:MAG: ribose 5-phosphate isomerase B [Candidatus Peregrinibacteria bacterium]|nr:ribose 5-phosphate isomerase B [Candidatus Peregrinibacteria bacterium]
MIYVGSDHAGYEMKEAIKASLKDNAGDMNFVDLGVFTTDSMDYPDIAREVAEKVSENHGAMGILVCGTGTGMVIAANKLNGIRAAAVTTDAMAEMARRHNNANIITLGSRIIDQESAKRMVKIFLETPFDGDERHQRRIDKISEIERARDEKK